jgi:hypothetical protein
LLDFVAVAEYFSWPIMITGVMTVLVIGLLVAWGVGALERRRRADDEAARLQTELAEPMSREPALAGASILPVATIPGAGRPSVELTGVVPSAAARDVAIAIAERELARLRPGMSVVDRLEIRRSA